MSIIPKDIPTFCLSVTVLEYIRDNISTSKKVLEFGSGITTKIIKDLRYDLTSIEHDEAYAKQTGAILAPIVDGWYDRSIVDSVLENEEFGFVIVDGPLGKIGRHHFLLYLDHPAISSADILVDDVNRSAERFIADMILKTGLYKEIPITSKSSLMKLIK